MDGWNLEYISSEDDNYIFPGSCGQVFTKTNSWAGNVQGTLKFVVEADISSYTIQLQTSKRLTNIEVFFSLMS